MPPLPGPATATYVVPCSQQRAPAMVEPISYPADSLVEVFVPVPAGYVPDPDVRELVLVPAGWGEWLPING